MMLKTKMMLGGLTVIMWGAAVLASAVSEAADRPVLVAEETRYEFGTVMEGAVVSHGFVIANKGTVPLRILKIESG